MQQNNQQKKDQSDNRSFNTQKQRGKSNNTRQPKPSKYPLYVADALFICIVFYITDFHVPLKIFFAGMTRLLGYSDAWTRDASGFIVGGFLIGGLAAWSIIRFDFLPRYVKGGK